MSKKATRINASFSKNWMAAIAGSLFLSSAAQSAEAHDRVHFRDFKDSNPGLGRRELRTIFRNSYGRRSEHSSFTTPNNGTTTVQNIRCGTEPPVVEPVNDMLARVANYSVQKTESGSTVKLAHGINLDLNSQEQSITLGAKLFSNVASVEIELGGEKKVLLAGQNVTPAEYIAAKQVLVGSGQSVQLDSAGRAIGGNVDLSEITVGNEVMRANDLVVPVAVTASGDFSRGSDFKLLGDLSNHGTVRAFDGEGKNRGGAIRAEDIFNDAGAHITSDVDLTLQANGGLTNLGSITSNGNLTLNAASITNSGTVSSKNNVNIEAANDCELHVDNSGGTISAEHDINIRALDYNGAANSYITGGDLLSEQLNLHAGQGTIESHVGNVTGRVNSDGYAVHFSSEAETLSIGNTDLFDPTYSNIGNISIDGNIDVSAALTIIASGNVFNTVTGIRLSTNNNGADANGNALTIIAGANITTGGTNSNIGPIPPALAGTLTTFDQGSAAGGNIILDGVTLNTGGSGSTGTGGNVLLAAFDGSTKDGDIILRGASSIHTGGEGSGSNGSVEIIGYGVIDTHSLGGAAIVTTGGTGAGGDVHITVATPESNGPVTYAADGTLQSSSLTASKTLSSSPVTLGIIDSADEVVIRSAGDVTIKSDVSAKNAVTIDVTAGSGGIDTEGIAQVEAPSVTVLSGIGGIGTTTGFNFGDGSGDASITAQANGGAVFLTHIGTGTVILNGTAGNTDFTLSTTGTGVVTNGNIAGAGLFNLTADLLINDNVIGFSSINVESNDGSGLIIDGLKGGSFSALGATTLTGSDLNLTLNGQTTINGLAVLNAESTESTSVINNVGAVLNVNGNLSINSCVFVQNGTLDVTGSTSQFCKFGIGTLVNTVGDIVISGNYDVIGGFFAIIASGSISAANGVTLLDVSQCGCSGQTTPGSFFAFAGVNITPATPGQIFNGTKLFTLNGPSTTGGNVNLGGVNVDSFNNTKGVAGPVQIYAFSGTKAEGNVAIGNISSNAITDGADVSIIAPGDISTGLIVTTGSTSSGDVRLISANPVLDKGSLTVLNGVVTGTVSAGTLSNGSIDYTGIVVGSGSIDIIGDLSTPPVGVASGNTVNLRSLLSIGLDEVTRVQVNANNLTIDATDSAFVRNQNIGNSNLLLSGAGSTFDFIADGDLKTSDVSAASIRLDTNGSLGVGGIITGTKSIVLFAGEDLSSTDIAPDALVTPFLNLGTSNGADVGSLANPFVVGEGVATIFVDTLGPGGDSAFITATRPDGVKLATATVTGDFKFLSTTTLSVVGNVTNVDGDISITSSDGVLLINGVTISANSPTNNANLEIILDDPNPDKHRELIQLVDGTKLLTMAGTKPGGNILLRLGPAPDPKKIKPIKKAPSGIKFDLKNGGIIQGAPKKGISADPENDPPTNIITADNATVTILNDLKADNILLQGNVIITADPPVTTAMALSVENHTNSDSVSANLSVNPLVFADNTATSLSAPTNAGTISASPIDSIAKIHTDLTLASLRQGSYADTISGAGSHQPRTVEDDSTYTSNEPRAMSFDVNLCSDMDLGLAANRELKPEHSDCVTIRKGSSLFVATTDTKVVTPKGSVTIAAKSVALVTVDDNHLSVYNIDDHHKDSVIVESGGQEWHLSPGRHVTITDHNRVAQFADINPIEAVPHRRVARHELSANRKAFTSEFSVPSVLSNVHPLRKMASSSNAQAKKAISHILKTTAITMQLGSRDLPFEHQVRPRTVALSR